MAKRPASGQSAGMHSRAERMNLFVLVKTLFQYLERVDKTMLDLAKEVSLCLANFCAAAAALYHIKHYMLICRYLETPHPTQHRSSKTVIGSIAKETTRTIL